MNLLSKKTEKAICNRKQKIKQLAAEKRVLASKLENLKRKKDASFDFGFAISLILLCRSYPPLHEHAFNIFEEAGYELSDFTHVKLDPSDRETLKIIFSV